MGKLSFKVVKELRLGLKTEKRQNYVPTFLS